jgi:hypothetical protein
MIIASLSCACEPDLVVGTWTCTTSLGAAGPVDGGVTYPITDPVEIPWASGFEDGFCGYNDAKGWCYAHTGARYASVLSPVHSGKRAASFSINTEDTGAGADTRCAREGTLPLDAYYGAWFYLSSLPQSIDNWNLMHFQGGNGGPTWQGLWDVTLAPTAGGGFGLEVVQGTPLGPDAPPAVPIATWFHVVFHFVRATDASGEVTLYQGDQQLFDAKGIVTDPYPYDQWYVGNLANGTTEPDLTVYVDDVSVSASR